MINIKTKIASVVYLLNEIIKFLKIYPRNKISSETATLINKRMDNANSLGFKLKTKYKVYHVAFNMKNPAKMERVPIIHPLTLSQVMQVV